MWDIHPCWYDHEASGDNNDFIIQHYKQLKVRALSESGGAYRSQSRVAASVAKASEVSKKSESILDIVASTPIDLLLDTPILYKYQLKLLIDGRAYSIVQLEGSDGEQITCVIAANLLNILAVSKKNNLAHYRLRVATFDYGKRKIRYVSEVCTPSKVNAEISGYVGVILAVGNTYR